MDPRVQCYLEKQEAEIAKQEKEKKDAILIKVGLYEKEYSADGKFTPEYHYEERDAKTKRKRYFKIVPIGVSDEEYRRICAVSVIKPESDETKVDTENAISSFMKGVAIFIFILGFFGGLILGVESSGYRFAFNFSNVLIVWVVSFISGIIFWGFAEIIRLLDKISQK